MESPPPNGEQSHNKEGCMPPVISESKCARCGTCVDVCAEDVFFGSVEMEIPLVTYPDECVYCNGCVDECPVDGAIRLRIPLPMMLMYKPA
jgi:NAD-dependent dihydropyrimidine dehydrogenase PreA subunit